MDLNASTLWWLAAGALVAIELASGTFYLLMLAIGCAAAAMAAHAGIPISGQLLAAATIGGGAVALWHQRRSRVPAASAAARNRDVHLDIGSAVQVEGWQTDGTARVQYRGAGWDVSFAGSGAPAPGEHIVFAVEGNRLLLKRAGH